MFGAWGRLGVGDSTIPEGNALTVDNVAAANHATVQEVMRRLYEGTLVDGLGPITNATTLGIGQSMGGCFAIVAQGQLGTFDGVGILGYSGIHTVVPTRPGQPEAVWPWISRQSSLDNPKILNGAALEASEGPTLGDHAAISEAAARGEHPFQWSFHYDDEPADIVALDMAASAGLADPLPAWRSATTPSCHPETVRPLNSRQRSLDKPTSLYGAGLVASEGPTLGEYAAISEAAARGEHPFQWSFHYDDEPAIIGARHMAASAGLADPLPAWRSATTPSCGVHMVAPGAVALEAAAITVPVLVAVGERDVVPDPWMEPKAFKSAHDEIGRAHV